MPKIFGFHQLFGLNGVCTESSHFLYYPQFVIFQQQRLNNLNQFIRRPIIIHSHKQNIQYQCRLVLPQAGSTSLYLSCAFLRLIFLLFSDLKSIDYLSTSVVKMMPFLLFWIQGALGLISMSASVMPLIRPRLLWNLTSGSLIRGRQKDSLNEQLPTRQGQQMEHSRFLTQNGVISSSSSSRCSVEGPCCLLNSGYRSKQALHFPCTQSHSPMLQLISCRLNSLFSSSRPLISFTAISFSSSFSPLASMKQFLALPYSSRKKDITPAKNTQSDFLNMSPSSCFCNTPSNTLSASLTNTQLPCDDFLSASRQSRSTASFSQLTRP